MKVKEKFLRYAATDTASEPDSPETPSTDKQRVFAEMLCDELRGMGAEDVKISDNAYVYARIPSNVKRDIPKIGFIAHLDTAPAVSGTGVKPRVFENYDGGTLEIGNGVSIRPEEFCHLSNYIGQDIITSSGDTLLGADDKAGIAEIMELCEILLCDKSIEHGEIGVAFTPDEEIGHGAALLDIEGFGCKYAYTVDGGALGELEYENFNAAQAEIRIKGVSIHPGDAKGKMKNALLIANELVSKFPVEQTPAKTEGYEGFFHFDELNATVESAKLVCIIRDHDAEKFSAKAVCRKSLPRNKRCLRRRNGGACLEGQLPQYARENFAAYTPDRKREKVYGKRGSKARRRPHTRRHRRSAAFFQRIALPQPLYGRTQFSRA